MLYQSMSGDPDSGTSTFNFLILRIQKLKL